MRDPTRGGLATTLAEIAQSSNIGIEINEASIPISPKVKHFAEVLGFDPLYIANEGKFVIFVARKDAPKVKKALGPQARIIGKTTTGHQKETHLITKLGSSRILPMLEQDQLPRIC